MVSKQVVLMVLGALVFSVLGCRGSLKRTEVTEAGTVKMILADGQTTDQVTTMPHTDALQTPLPWGTGQEEQWPEIPLAKGIAFAGADNADRAGWPVVEVTPVSGQVFHQPIYFGSCQSWFVPDRPSPLIAPGIGRVEISMGIAGKSYDLPTMQAQLEMTFAGTVAETSWRTLLLADLSPLRAAVTTLALPVLMCIDPPYDNVASPPSDDRVPWYNQFVSTSQEPTVKPIPVTQPDTSPGTMASDAIGGPDDPLSGGLNADEPLVMPDDNPEAEVDAMELQATQPTINVENTTDLDTRAIVKQINAEAASQPNEPDADLPVTDQPDLPPATQPE